MDRMTLEQIFVHADLDDLSVDADGLVDLDITLRESDEWYRFHGINLEDCLEQATTLIQRAKVVDTLRREGLTDSDIDRLAAADEVWTRGYIAGATETAEALAEGNLRLPPRTAPAMAAAAEPITTSTIEGALQQEGALDMLVNGDGIAVTLALIHQAKIVLS